MIELVFASSNEGKIKEIHQILGNSIIIKGLKDINIFEEIPETGKTFYENAYLKADYVYRKSGKNVFADDSGLEINALNGEPGVHSAYYAGLPRNDFNNIQRVLNKLKNVSDRRARFVCVICLIFNAKVYYFEGLVNGKIAEEEKGNNGFGYDPVFIPDGYEQTFAEMSLDVKNKISHRSLALMKMKEFLKDIF